MDNDPDLASARAERELLLPDLWAAIARMGQKESLFWLCELLLDDIRRETGYEGPGAACKPLDDLQIACAAVDHAVVGHANGDVVVALSLAMQRCFVSRTGLPSADIAVRIFDEVAEMIRDGIRKDFAEAGQ